VTAAKTTQGCVLARSNIQMGGEMPRWGHGEEPAAAGVVVVRCSRDGQVDRIDDEVKDAVCLAIRCRGPSGQQGFHSLHST
jgi:hypothetical protein